MPRDFLHHIRTPQNQMRALQSIGRRLRNIHRAPINIPFPQLKLPPPDKLIVTPRPKLRQTNFSYNTYIPHPFTTTNFRIGLIWDAFDQVGQFSSKPKWSVWDGSAWSGITDMGSQDFGYCYYPRTSLDGQLIVTVGQDVDDFESDFRGLYSNDGGATWQMLPRPSQFDSDDDFGLLGDVAIDINKHLWVGDQGLIGGTFFDWLKTTDLGVTYEAPFGPFTAEGITASFLMRISPLGIKLAAFDFPSSSQPFYRIWFADIEANVHGNVEMPAEVGILNSDLHDGQWFDQDRFLFAGEAQPFNRIWLINTSSLTFSIVYESDDAVQFDDDEPNPRVGYSFTVVDVWGELAFVLKAGRTSIFIDSPPAPPTVILRSVDGGLTWTELPTPYEGKSGAATDYNMTYHPNENALYIAPRVTGTIYRLPNADTANGSEWQAIPSPEDSQWLFTGAMDRALIRVPVFVPPEQ